MAWFKRRQRGTGSEAVPYYAGNSDGDRSSEDFRAGDVAESSSGGFFSSFLGGGEGGSGDSGSGGDSGGGGGGGD